MKKRLLHPSTLGAIALGIATFVLIFTGKATLTEASVALPAIAYLIWHKGKDKPVV